MLIDICYKQAAPTELIPIDICFLLTDYSHGADSKLVFVFY